jgi:hypothetical protein
MSVYSKHFRSSGKDWHQWKEYKARLARKYKKIKVEVLNLRILANDGLAMATFTQKYGNEHFESMGKKTLFLRQNSIEWKIIGEEFESSGMQPLKGRREVAPAPPEPVVAKKEPSTSVVATQPEPKEEGLTGMSDMAEIQDFLGRWEKAWEEENFGLYMACYDSGFHLGNMDFRAWKAHKKKVNRKYRSISVDIKDLKVEQPSPFVAKASFRQKYKAHDYQDEGFKSVLLIKKGKRWKIKEEEWRPLDSGSRP